MVSLCRPLVLLCLLLVPRAMSAGEPKFKLHEIHRPGGGKYGQTSLVDVDCDGDVDICSKPWDGDRHVFLENLLIHNPQRSSQPGNPHEPTV